MSDDMTYLHGYYACTSALILFCYKSCGGMPRVFMDWRKHSPFAQNMRASLYDNSKTTIAMSLSAFGIGAPQVHTCPIVPTIFHQASKIIALQSPSTNRRNRTVN
eukprot:m.222051 g.222051  ORF g.222051 m.222051 type:complete len:105 (+) comp19193_c0_seq16:4377-4691(+)